MTGLQSRLFSEFLLLLFLSVSLVYALPYCDANLYGYPDKASCDEILRGTQSENGIAQMDPRSYLFGVPNLIQRPQDINRVQWLSRETIPILWPRSHCNAVLIPTFNLDNLPQYDTARYADIANSGSSILSECYRPSRRPMQITGGVEVVGDRNHLDLILYERNSLYGRRVNANIALGRIFDFNGKGYVLSLPEDIHPPVTPNTNTDSSSSTTLNPGIPNMGLMCGQYCSGPKHLCTGKDGCKCIADPGQGSVGSGFFTGKCKIPYIYQHSGRELQEVEVNTPVSANTTGLIQATDLTNLTNIACPCNCTYVSHACCTSESGIVFEAPQLRLGSLQPPSANLSCNAGTGEFQAVL